MTAVEVSDEDLAEFERRLGVAREREAAVDPVLQDGRRVVWAPQEGSQSDFMQCPLFECLYHGTRGPGKTDGLLMAFAQHVGRGYRDAWRGIIFRQTYPQLADVQAKSEKWFRRIFPGARFNRGKMQWEFASGETLLFRHMARRDDYWNYHGHEYPFIGFEELTNWPSDDCFRLMLSCCRSPTPDVPHMVRATTNPYGCVPFGEVLTDDRGWVPIEDMRQGDGVVTVTADGSMGVGQVSATHAYDYDGTMVVRAGRGLYMEFTEDHRLPLLDTNRHSHEIRSFRDLPGQAILRRTGTQWVVDGSPQRFAPPEVKTRRLKARVESLPLIDFAALLGWYLSDGCVLLRDRAFCISQQKTSGVVAIRELLDRCGFHYRYDGQQFYVSEPSWAEYFAQFGKARNKHVPQWVKQQPADVLRAFFDAAMAGDGCDGIYYTISRRLADDVAEIAVKLGLAVFVSSRQRLNRDGLCWQVCTSDRDTVQLHTGNHVYDVASRCASINVERRVSRERVYCLTVPGTETFFIRQNGCVWLSGNSGHNWVKDRYRLHGRWWETVFVLDAKAEDGTPEHPRCAIHGHIDENQILLAADPRYKTTIAASASNKGQLAAWLDGSWDFVAGGMFDDVWSPRHNVFPDFDVPASWRLDRSFDWGSARPFSVGWWAQSDGSDVRLRDGRVFGTVRGDLFRVREWYGWSGKPNEGQRMLAIDVARGIVEREIAWGWRGPRGCRVQAGPADSSIFAVENGVGIALDMAKPVRVGNGVYHGVQWVAADKSPGSRKNGWELMRRMIANARPRPGLPREAPGLFVVGAQCAQFLRTVITLPRDEKDLDDVDTDAEDHIADEVRYKVRSCGAEVRSLGTTGMF